MRLKGLVMLAGLAFAVSAMPLAGTLPAEAQVVRDDGQRVTITPPGVVAQPRRRAPTRLYISRERTYLPPTAVRTCDAWYEQEFRPSGTVIVPRMRCRWVAG